MSDVETTASDMPTVLRSTDERGTKLEFLNLATWVEFRHYIARIEVGEVRTHRRGEVKSSSLALFWKFGRGNALDCLEFAAAMEVLLDAVIALQVDVCGASYPLEVDANHEFILFAANHVDVSNGKAVVWLNDQEVEALLRALRFFLGAFIYGLRWAWEGEKGIRRRLNEKMAREQLN